MRRGWDVVWLVIARRPVVSALSASYRPRRLSIVVPAVTALTQVMLGDFEVQVVFVFCF